MHINSNPSLPCQCALLCLAGINLQLPLVFFPFHRRHLRNIRRKPVCLFIHAGRAAVAFRDACVFVARMFCVATR